MIPFETFTEILVTMWSIVLLGAIFSLVKDVLQFRRVKKR